MRSAFISSVYQSCGGNRPLIAQVLLYSDEAVKLPSTGVILLSNKFNKMAVGLQRLWLLLARIPSSSPCLYKSDNTD